MDKALGSTNNYTDKMSSVPVPAQENYEQAGMPKSMVPDLGWFNGNRTKFKDWWREIRLFLKSNRITVILTCLRESIAGIYV